MMGYPSQGEPFLTGTEFRHVSVLSAQTNYRGFLWLSSDTYVGGFLILRLGK